jgi:hypothetical protein
MVAGLAASATLENRRPTCYVCKSVEAHGTNPGVEIRGRSAGTLRPRLFGFLGEPGFEPGLPQFVRPGVLPLDQSPSL